MRGQKGLGFVYLEVGEMWNGKWCKKGVKTPNLPKKRPAVPVPINAVLVQVALCHFLL